MNSEQNLIQFWEIVKACLTELYKMPDEAATKAIQRLWSRGPKGVRVIPSARNLVYHADPIHIASDLAGDEIPSEILWNGYKRLRLRYEPSLKMVGLKGVANVEAREVKSVRHAKRAIPQKMYAGR